MRRCLALLLAICLLPLLRPAPMTTAQTACPGPTTPDWLAAVNATRCAAGLQAVVQNTDEAAGPTSADATSASIYAIANNCLGTCNPHIQVPTGKDYTAGGAAAAAKGDMDFNGYSGSAAPLSPVASVAGWMGDAYHWEPILDPNLQSVAYGSAGWTDVPGNQNPPPAYSATNLIVTSASTLVFNRPTFNPPAAPIMWPPDGGTTPYTSRTPGESPDPMANCTNFPNALTATTGPSIDLQLPFAPPAPAGLSVSLSEGAAPLTPPCWFTAANVRFAAADSDAFTTGIATGVLSDAHAIVIFPQNVFSPGVYHVTITNKGQPFCSWSFSVAPTAPPPADKNCPGGSAAAAAQPGANPAAPWSGNWTSSFGCLALAQTGNQVTGSYSFVNTPNSTPTPGTVTGTVTGSTLAGTWAQPNGSGGFTMALAANGQSFAGTYGYGADSVSGGAWNGTGGCTPAAAPATNAGPNWSAALSNCFGAISTQTGATVFGTYTTSAVTGTAVAGTLTGTVTGNVLNGTFSEPPNGGTFQLTASADGQTYSGAFTLNTGGGGACNGPLTGS